MTRIVAAAVILFGMAACGNTHTTTPVKPKVCIVGQEDDMPPDTSVDYIRCTGCRVEVYDNGDREVICPPGYELPVMRVHG